MLCCLLPYGINLSACSTRPALDGSTVVVRPRTVTMNIEVHVDTDPLRMKNTAGVLHITEDPVEMIVYDDETRPQAACTRP